MNEYKPNLKDVTIRALEDWHMMPTKKGLVEAMKSISGNSIKINAVLYLVPAAIEGDSFTLKKKYSLTEKLSKVVVLGLSSALLAGQFELYRSAIENGNSEYLLLPVITNVISGLYEKGKSVKAKLIEEKSLNISIEKTA